LNETGLRQLSEKLIGTEIKAELLRLFHMNPGILDTIDSIARRIGRMPNDVETEIVTLLDLGVLRKERFGKLDVLSLNTRKDKEVQEKLAALIEGGVKE